MIDFSWDGTNEMMPALGRGWATLKDSDLLGGIFIHDGSGYSFVASFKK